MKKIIVLYRRIIENLLSRLNFFIPLNNQRIIVNRSNGKGFGDNQKYIIKELLKRNSKYDIVWLVKDPNSKMPDGVRKVKYNSLSALWNILTAHIYLGNEKSYVYPKKKGQIYIQTWHGDFPLKYIEKEAEDDLKNNFPGYVENSIKDSKKTDYIISGNGFFSEIIRKSFWYEDIDILEFGTPRNDIYFETDDEKINKLKKEIVGCTNCKILCYAPTFRDNHSIEGYNLDVHLIKNVLEEKTGETWKVVIRMHPDFSETETLFAYSDDILNGTAIEDSQCLFLVSDILITDYSSVMHEFAVMRKPVFLFTSDYDVYTKKCRGLRPLYHTLPYLRANNNYDLIMNIREIDFEEYTHNIEKFVKQKIKDYNTGHASEQIADLIQNIILKEKTYAKETHSCRCRNMELH